MKAQPITNALDSHEAEHRVRPRSTLHVIADMNAEHGGSVRVVADLCQALEGSGIKCEIATLQRQGTSGATAETGDATLHVFRATRPRRLGNSLDFARWLRRNIAKYELVEIHEVFRLTSLIAARFAHRNRIPYLVHPHGSLDPFDLCKHRLAKRALAPLFRSLLLGDATGIVFTSTREHREADTFASRAPRYHVPPVILHNGARGDGARLRGALGVADETFLLLFMSRIDYKKGLIRTLRALPLASVDGKRVELVIAGSGDPGYEQLVRSEVTRLRLQHLVHFVGFVQGQAKADALAAADALVLVSDNENFGIIVVEALRAGCPVIISDRVATAGELSRTGAAMVVPPTVEATAKALRAAAALDGPARLRWSAAAARVAGRLYDGDSVVRAQLALRRRVMATSSDSPRARPHSVSDTGLTEVGA